VGAWWLVIGAAVLTVALLASQVIWPGSDDDLWR
jgi:hypothetical protein